MFFLQLTFARNGRPGWPIYNEKYAHFVDQGAQNTFRHFAIGFKMF